MFFITRMANCRTKLWCISDDKMVNVTNGCYIKFKE